MALAPQFHAVHCSLCDDSIETVGAAIEDGWEPSYFEGSADDGYDDEIGEPVCPKCAATKCRMMDDGLELIDLESVVKHGDKVKCDQCKRPGVFEDASLDYRDGKSRPIELIGDEVPLLFGDQHGGRKELILCADCASVALSEVCDA